ncbi:MAG: cytochrome c oxidase subunit II [Gammaproteobacteria bacterium]|nr:cytochrome c oxidase subunit II [Gammaproteobacteria bacterium]
MALAIVLLIVIIGSVAFNWLSPWWFTDIASNWGNIDTTVFITFWVCGIVFVAVCLFMTYCVWKFRHKEGSRADYEPENSRLEWWLTVVTTIGVVAMLAPGLVVWDDYVNVPPDAQEFEVLAKQWTWAFRFPGEDGKLGTVDTTNIGMDNPFGMNMDDPNGADDVLVPASRVHLPKDQPVKVWLRSIDVLHDFFVPEFRAKMDAVPGMVTYFWFEPTKVGEYEILCAELCGVGHFSMRGRVQIDTQEDFDAWLDAQPTWAEMQAGITPKSYSAMAMRGRDVAETNGCFACHTLDGSVVVGPTWQGLWGSTRTMTDGSEVVVDDAYIDESVRNPAVKVVEGFAPVMIPYDLSEEDMQALIEYLREETGAEEPMSADRGEDAAPADAVALNEAAASNQGLAVLNAQGG